MRSRTPTQSPQSLSPRPPRASARIAVSGPIGDIGPARSSPALLRRRLRGVAEPERRALARVRNGVRHPHAENDSASLARRNRHRPAPVLPDPEAPPRRSTASLGRRDVTHTDAADTHAVALVAVAQRQDQPLARAGVETHHTFAR